MKFKTKRFLSGLLAVVTIATSAIQPVPAFAAEGEAVNPPPYETVKEFLDADEVVIAKDLEIEVGSSFDIEKDFTNIEIPDSKKVRVTFEEAMNAQNESFTSSHEDTYKAVYYVKPQTTDHPTYQINRKIIVKDTAVNTTSDSGGSQSERQSDSGVREEAAEDEESDTENVTIIEQKTEEVTETEASDNVEQKAESQPEVLSEEKFDAEIESTENQEMVDPETGTTLSEVMEEAGDQGIALEELEAGETVTFEMPMLLAANVETGSQSVSITAGSWYYYADYGLGSYLTCPYYVKWGSITATAYCVQPSKKGPDDGTYSITKLSDGKTLAKVCYYGTKASDENGFFDEKHPDFSAGKRFIITHIAVAYANGSSDWDSGTNATGRSLAMELYNYCINMPDIPDVDMSFSDNDVKAYVEGNIQRTKTITFKADKLQTITFKLPQGVKLVNVTTGKTSSTGASVEICGGTKFYLTAPLSQAEDVSASFSSKMKGSIDKEFSAYKITTGSSTQDLALVFGEGVGNEKYVDFKVTWTKECYVSIVKEDSETSNTLAGAVYGIYSDAACTKLIKQMPATDANGASKVTLEKTQEVVYLKEISVPTGYMIDTKAYNITLNIGKTLSQNVTDKRVTATISLYKQDSETGNEPQGDATLEGAVYGLFASEDIVHPDGKTGILYKKGTQITSLTTDKNGQAVVSNLYLGKYYLKELNPPAGYLLDKEEHIVDCSYEGANVATVERKVISKEDVIKQPFQIIKAANNGKTDADLLEGVGFSAWLISDLNVKADGSYDFSSANPVVITANGKTEMFTDEKGYACSIPLPYGTYVVKETTSKHNYEPVDDFIVTINENHPDTPQVWRVLLDNEFEAKLKIIKKDDETKKSVLLANTEFKVYDLDHQKYVEQVTTYPSTKVHKSYFTDENGYLILPNNLRIGNYRVTVADTAEIQPVEMKDEVPTGLLIINKKGEFLDSVTLTSQIKGMVEHIFNYISGNLTEVTFDVFAEEDIKAADGVSEDYYKAGDKIATITTDENGVATLTDLPLGKYYAKEVSTAHGYVLDDEIRHIDLTYRNQDTPIVTFDEDWQNNRQRVEVSVLKKEKDSDRVLEGGVFGLFASEDIVSSSGKVLIEADEIIELKSTDSDGKIIFIADLPIDAKYYVKEIYAPAGFVNTEERQEFTAAYTGDSEKSIQFAFTFEDEPTTVEITKSALTTGKEIPGCNLKVTDENDNVVDEWTSTEEAHIIKELVVGKKYTLTEMKPADGFVTAESIEFTIENTAEVQKVEMKDDVTKVEISKQDISGKELPGAKLSIIDADGKVVESWTSTKEAHYIEMLPIGKYTLREESAPEGYLVAEEIEFEVLDTGEVQHVVMVDEAVPERPQTTDTPKTGDESNMPLWLFIFGMGVFGFSVSVALRFRRKKNK